MASQGNGKEKKKEMLKDRNYPFLREYKGAAFELGSLRQMGAHSVGIGRKRVEGETVDKLCLRYYIAKKRPLDQISSAERIPKEVRFFSRKVGKTVKIVTDVIEAPHAQYEEFDPEKRHRPVPGGVSGGASGQSGTIGGWVWDTTDDTIVLLSNAHVLGTVAGLEILQQSVTDGGASPADRIGQVKRGLERSTTEVNTVDGAVGDPDSIDICDLKVEGIGPAVFETGLPQIDLLVEKYGQSTRHTFGTITDADWSGFVSGHQFEDCFRIAPVDPSPDWSAGGDSGSIIFSQSHSAADPNVKPAVGLHFAGVGTHGIGCKIQNVFAQLHLDTLASGAFSAFVEGLFEAEAQGQPSEETEAELRTLSALAARSTSLLPPRPFVRRELERWRASRFHCGIWKDLENRLASGKNGRVVTGCLSGHRAELVTLLAQDGDVRRATVIALRPLLGGAVTTTDVLERLLTDQDLSRLDKLAREIGRKASKELKQSLDMLRSLKGKAEGLSLADVLGIRL